MRKLLILLLFLFATSICYSQVFVNRVWHNHYGNPLLLKWSKTILAKNDELLTVGNSQVMGEGANILLSRYATDGILLWSTQYY